MHIPLPDQSRDVLLCAEILEHLPFDQFEPALREIARVCRIGVVLSLPHYGPYLKFGFKVSFLRERKWIWKLPWPRKHIRNPAIGHEWEIGKRGTRAGKIRRILEAIFHIEREYILWENHYHHFYVLRPRRSIAAAPPPLPHRC